MEEREQRKQIALLAVLCIALAFRVCTELPRDAYCRSGRLARARVLTAALGRPSVGLAGSEQSSNSKSHCRVGLLKDTCAHG
jgi:hypothetical protein